MSEHPSALGIDLGGTKIEGVLLAPGAGPHDSPLWRRRIPTPRPHAYEPIVEAVAGLVQEGLSQLATGAPCVVGLGIPGSADPQTGLVRNANTTALIGKPLQRDLEARLSRPVALENDANCFALAEALFGAGRGHGLVFGVIMGTGCGGGLCLEGRLRQGPQGIAGEWGHAVMAPHGAQCYCGNRGCVETMLSGGGVEQDFLRRHGRRLSMRELVQGARSGDPHCRERFEIFLEDFGRCLGGVASILDPDCIVLGGGLSNIDELYEEGRRRMNRYIFHEAPSTLLRKNELGDAAGVFGAALVGLERQNGQGAP